ncbi:MAG: zinc-binding dehydrogenase [Clostridia bacterium]|nr:zinc-binding dehydrogenase [Clostridia bacterium]
MENKRIATLSAGHSIVEDVPMPEMNDNLVLIRQTFVGVCMSEHYRWANATERSCFGHEPVGVVEAVGKNVTGWQVGDRVGGLWGNPLPGGGGMVRYTAVDPTKRCLIHLPDGIRDEDLLVEPLACLVSAVSKARVNIPGMEVCVVGAGYMGCGAISLLKLRGAFVTAVDIRPECLRDAQKYGADTVLSVEQAEQMIQDGFKGFDVVMEWGETSESLDLAARLTAQCGQLCIGAYHTGEPRSVNMQLLNVRAIDCLSTHPREKALNHISARNAVKLLERGRWNFKNIPTKVYPMCQFDRAQAELETKYGKYMKAVIDMSRLDGEPYVI